MSTPASRSSFPGIVRVVHEPAAPGRPALAAILAESDEQALRAASVVQTRWEERSRAAIALGRAPGSCSTRRATRWSCRRAATWRRDSPISARTLEASYYAPYISIAPMEPRAATAHWEDGAPHSVGGDAEALRHPLGARRALRDARGPGARHRARDRGRLRGEEHLPARARGGAARARRGPARARRLQTARRRRSTRPSGRPRSSPSAAASTRTGCLVAWEYEADPRRRARPDRAPRLGVALRHGPTSGPSSPRPTRRSPWAPTARSAPPSTTSRASRTSMRSRPPRGADPVEWRQAPPRGAALPRRPRRGRPPLRLEIGGPRCGRAGRPGRRRRRRHRRRELRCALRRRRGTGPGGARRARLGGYRLRPRGEPGRGRQPDRGRHPAGARGNTDRGDRVRGRASCSTPASRVTASPASTTRPGSTSGSWATPWCGRPARGSSASCR